jgi:UDP-N-acetylglucosamine 3-dehydrogenase
MAATIGKEQPVLTVGLIGVGQVGQRHAEAFAGLAPGVRIIGVADVDEELAADVAATYDTRPFADYQELLDLAPDIAVISLPHHLHREAGVAAAEAGSHILMEKPLAHTLEDAHAILEVCRQRDVRMTISFVHRYRTELQRAARVIADGDVGIPAVALDNFCSQGGSHPPGWVWEKEKAGGGVLMYGGIHSIDRLRWLLDSDVEEVFACTATYSQRVDVEDGLTATVVFENGCLATLFENSPAYLVTPRFWDTEIYGSQGCVRVRTGQHIEYTSESQAYRLDVERDDNFGAQAREFVSALREHREPWITGQDGLRALEVAMAIYRSSESRQPVSLADLRA